jgi:hypothetical protein
MIAAKNASLKAASYNSPWSSKFSGMDVNCQQHRKSMELLSLRIRVEKGISDPKEREEVKRRIRVLEKELEID